MNRREFEFTKEFSKKIFKIKGKEAQNIVSKINEILSCENIEHYKNLKHSLKSYKRVHVNNCYVILFQDSKGKIVFVDYDHHDKIYRK